ncbi:MAG: glycosyltransferase [Coprobacter sp.]|nr:glycosyltransferase [Coprobacter sp.]
MKRTVKIKFVDYWGSFYESEIDDCLIMKILRKHYDVKVCDDADYVFFSAMGESHWSVPDRCIKIYQTGENLVPDFNACDYAIGFEWMEYEDRYIRFPNYMFYGSDLLHAMEHKHELPDDWDLHMEKPDFCSFVVSNPRNPKRNEAFEALCKYKKVDSGGHYLNNVGAPVKDKLAFDRTHRFSLCFENGAHSGYTTEKLVQAFAARTVPIYWGDPAVGRVFNKKALIDAYAFDSFDSLVARIRELENDEIQYLQMLCEPALLPHIAQPHESFIDSELERFEAWLLRIFEQPLEQAYRRNREMHGRWYIERRFKIDAKVNKSAIRQIRKQRIIKAWNYLKRKIVRR